VETGGDATTRIERQQKFLKLRDDPNYPASYRYCITNYDWCFLNPENMGGSNQKARAFVELKSFLEAHGYKFTEDENTNLKFVVDNDS
jgi:hypothetical protein